jgi:hypothetical protein
MLDVMFEAPGGGSGRAFKITRHTVRRELASFGDEGGEPFRKIA